MCCNLAGEGLSTFLYLLVSWGDLVLFKKGIWIKRNVKDSCPSWTNALSKVNEQIQQQQTIENHRPISEFNASKYATYY